MSSHGPWVIEWKSWDVSLSGLLPKRLWRTLRHLSTWFPGPLAEGSLYISFSLNRSSVRRVITFLPSNEHIEAQRLICPK